MKKAVKYIANDGTEFSNRGMCVDHENKLVYSGDPEYLLCILRRFVRENKELYDQYFKIKYLYDITIKRREDKKAFAITGVWQGSYGYISDPTTYLIPDLLISDPEAYKKEREAKVKKKAVDSFIGQGI